MVLGKPAVNVRAEQAAEERRDVAAGRHEIRPHPVDHQDRDPAHAVEPEADPVGLPRYPEHAEHRGNQVGEGAVAVARGDEHPARVSSAALVRRHFVGGEEHSGKPKDHPSLVINRIE